MVHTRTLLTRINFIYNCCIPPWYAYLRNYWTSMRFQWGRDQADVYTPSWCTYMHRSAYSSALTWCALFPTILMRIRLSDDEPKSCASIWYALNCVINWDALNLGSRLRHITWTASSEFGAYRLREQRRFRRACASAQSRQNLRCSLIQALSQEEPSDRKPDP